VLAVVALLAYAWNKRRFAANSGEFVHTLALFLLTTTLVLPLFTPYNQVLLLLPVLMLIREWSTLPRAARWLFATLVAWPVAVSAAMLLYPPQLESFHRTPLLVSALALFFPFFGLWFMLARNRAS
jgi:hypothetical protein